MKFTLHSLKVGDLLWAQIDEIVGNEEMIVSFQGDLMRVGNHSQKKFNVGEKVLVRVTQKSPLAFQLVSDTKEIATRINISV